MSKKNVRTSWEDLVYSSIIHDFTRAGSLDGAFMHVGPSPDWGVLTPGENKKSIADMLILPHLSMSVFYQSWVSDYPTMAL